MAWSPNEPEIEALTREALNLLSLEIDELYTVLGCQLLALATPARTVDIVIQVREIRKANRARRQAGSPPSEAAIDEWVNGVEKICRDLRGDGGRFIESMRQELKNGLCNKDVLNLVDDVDESKMQILIMIISAIVKIPAQFESISATLAAMFCKSLRKEVCR